MTAYTNWTVAEDDDGILITADIEGGVNPALIIRVQKSTGTVFVKGSPHLYAQQSNGMAIDSMLSLFGCVFSVYPNSLQVELDRGKKI